MSCRASLSLLLALWAQHRVSCHLSWALQLTPSASPMESCTSHFVVTEALLASVTCANHWFNDYYTSFWEGFRGKKSCSLQNYSPCWGKTVADCQEVITWAKKVGSSWAPRAWRVSQTKSKYVGCDSDLLFSCGHMLWQSAGRFFWATCALVGQHVQSLETIPRGTCILMVNIQIVNMPTYQLIYRQNMGKRR